MKGIWRASPIFDQKLVEMQTQFVDDYAHWFVNYIVDQ